MDTHGTDIRIIVARKKHAADCIESLGESGIGRRYFTDRRRTRHLILNGVEKKEIFVAVNGRREAAGFYWADAQGMFCGFPYLRLLAVRPCFRGKGVGKKLLGHFEENGFGLASKVFLAVSDFNAAAQRFYTRNGYIRVGSVPDLYKPGIAEILMMKSSS
jgi:ribosomal protein S18 acetylase RimI-like enzyme